MNKKTVVAAALLLAGCVQQNAVDSATIPGAEMDQVILRIKQEVAIYQQAQSRWQSDPMHDPAKQGITIQCGGQGNIDFKLTKLKLDLTTTISQKENGSLGLKIPFAGGIGSVGPGVSGSIEHDNTQELVLYTYPTTNTFQGVDIPTQVQQNSVIASTLIALRQSLIRGSANKPCLMLSIPGGKDDDTFSINFVVKKDLNPSLGFNFAILSASAGYDRASNVGNAITVTFASSGEALK